MKAFSSIYFGLLILLCLGCKSPEYVQPSPSYDQKPNVTVETKAAIVGGTEALQKKLTYPAKAKQQGLETVLIANVLVNKKGKVEQISFDDENQYGFKQAAKKALRRVTFRAGQRNGEPVNMYIAIPVKFEL